jgi:GDPmannose 4,6-dehydratase
MPLAIITGITGQDGSLLAALLLKKGYRVLGLISDRPTDEFRLDFLKIKDRVTLAKIELLDELQVKNLLLEYQPNEFYNLAAISSVGLSFKEPLATFSFNTRSVMNILEAIREVSPKTRFYQASSSEMFGNVGHQRLPIKESFLFHPVSPYGISKASAHWLTVNYREAYKLQTCCGILFNHESALRPDHFVIKKIVNTAIQIKNGKADSLQLGNIAIVRDWGYAPLYVDAMWRMMQQDKLDDYLICSGIPISLQKFVQNVFNALDLNANDHVRLDSGLLRSLDLEIIYGDNTKAKRELNWEYDLDPEQLIAQLIKDEYDFMNWKTSHGASL